MLPRHPSQPVGRENGLVEAVEGAVDEESREGDRGEGEGDGEGVALGRADLVVFGVDGVWGGGGEGDEREALFFAGLNDALEGREIELEGFVTVVRELVMSGLVGD